MDVDGGDATAGRLIVALDVPGLREAEALVDWLADLPVVFKIGHQLAFTGGLPFAGRLAAGGRDVFLDLKLHDIPRTVEEGVRALGGLGARFLTVHAYPQTMAAAVSGRAGGSTEILAVTVLTSMDDADLRAAGYARGVDDLVVERARQAREAGIDGLVCAAPDLSRVRPAAGPGLSLVVPGIRPAGSEAGDQKRVMTPAAAMRAGATHLVVGRPITGAADPHEAALAILDGMNAAT